MSHFVEDIILIEFEISQCNGTYVSYPFRAGKYPSQAVSGHFELLKVDKRSFICLVITKASSSHYCNYSLCCLQYELISGYSGILLTLQDRTPTLGLSINLVINFGLFFSKYDQFFSFSVCVLQGTTVWCVLFSKVDE